MESAESLDKNFKAEMLQDGPSDGMFTAKLVINMVTEEIAKSDQIKAEVEQSVIVFSLQENHRADVLEQLRLCALENIDTVGRSLINQKFFDLALPIFHNER